MKPCIIEWVDDRTVKFSGFLDEYTSFLEVVQKFPQEVWLDFGDVSRVNSLGVKEWIKAISTTESRLHYINCPAIIVDQFNMIPEFLGKNATIDSFEVFYACDDCGHEDSRFLKIGAGEDIDPRKEDLTDIPNLSCIKCGGTMELDHDPDIYFSFVRELDDTG